MPHQCTSCGRTFADGSKEMLSGCPDCGGNKFQFQPKGAVADSGQGSTGSESEATKKSTAANERGATGSSSGTERAERKKSAPADETSRKTDTRKTGTPKTDSPKTDTPATDPTPADVADENDAERVPDDKRTHAGEDTAQASARSDVVSPDELDRAAHRPDPDDAPAGADGANGGDDEHRPGIDDLREELNDQFESIRIVSPGKYELNLMELYDRQEYIISLQEDGRYVIEMPDAWGADDE